MFPIKLKSETTIKQYSRNVMSITQVLVNISFSQFQQSFCVCTVNWAVNCNGTHGFTNLQAKFLGTFY